MARLGDICDVFSGYALKSFNNCKGMPVIKIGNIKTNGRIDLFNCAYSEDCVDDKYISKKEDIYVALSGATTGKVGIMCNDGYLINQRVGVVRLKSKNVPIMYLMYYLQSKTEKILSDAVGVAQPNISPNQISAYKIPIDSISEMQEKANYLCKIDELIGYYKQQSIKIDKVVKSRFIELFGDAITNSKNLPTMPLGKVCYLKAGTTTSADEIFDYSPETPIPCYGGNGIRGYVKTATQKGEYPIIGRQGALCGNVQFATGEFHATEHAVLVKSLQGDNLVWLYYLLKYLDLYRYHTGAAQPGLSVKVLNTIDVPIAEKGLQDQFATFAQQTDKLKLEVQKSLEKLETLKKSLMQKYFG